MPPLQRTSSPLPQIKAIADYVERFATEDSLDFDRVAADALSTHSSVSLSVAEVGEWLIANPNAPQLDKQGHFGDPPVTVCSRGWFVVDVYFWRSPTTSIHDHGFAGAFTLLHGQTLQTCYRFTPQNELDGGVLLGRLSRAEVSQLGPGDVMPIASGSGLIHHTNHLEVPTITLCVRTAGGAHSGLQRRYFAGGISIPQPRDQNSSRCIPLVRLLSLTAPEQMVPYIANLAGAGRLDMALFASQVALNLPEQQPSAEQLATAIAQRAPAPGLEAALRRVFSHPAAVVARYPRLKTSEQRLAADLLSGCLTPEELTAALTAVRPAESPTAVARRWAARLVATKALPRRLARHVLSLVSAMP